MEPCRVPPTIPDKKLTWVWNRAVRTYEANDNKNAALSAKLATTLDGTIHQDITNPGYIRIPVCGPAEAFENWKNTAFQNTRSSTFPCNKFD